MYMDTITTTIRDGAEGQSMHTSVQFYGRADKKNATKRLRELMEKGFQLGKWSKDRSDWHKR